MPKSYLGHPVDFLNSGVTSKLTCLFHGLITISVTSQLLQYINDEEGTSFFHDLFYATVINLGAQIRGAKHGILVPILVSRNPCFYSITEIYRPILVYSLKN